MLDFTCEVSIIIWFINLKNVYLNFWFVNSKKIINSLSESKSIYYKFIFFQKKHNNYTHKHTYRNQINYKVNKYTLYVHI